jgi:catechol 2,3-dioxygenase-like lactoylglutathione lyase family enzyme
VLGEHPLNPILPAQDGARAERFYREVLGLEQVTPAGADPMAFRAGEGTTIVLSELRDRQPPPYPVVSFNVTGIEELVKELEAREVRFEELDVSSFRGVEGRTEGRITDFGPVKSTWIRDSEGNILALNELAAEFRAD